MSAGLTRRALLFVMIIGMFGVFQNAEVARSSGRFTVTTLAYQVKSVHFGGLHKHAFCTQESTNSCSINLYFRVINEDMSSTSRRFTYVTTSHLRHGVYFILYLKA